MTTTPDQVPGLLFWYKADSITGLTSGQALNTNATLWPDSGPNGWHITSFVSPCPTWQTAQVNGLPGVVFTQNTTGGYLQLPAAALGALANKPGVTVHALVKMSTAGHTGYALHVSTAGGSGPARFNLDHKSAASSPRPLEAGGRRLDTDSIASVAINGAVADNTFYIETGRADYTGNSISVRVNGGAWTTTSAAFTSGGGNSDTGNSTEIDLGGNPGANPASVVMTLVEIFAHGRVLTDTENANLDSYLSDRSAITVSDYVTTTNLAASNAPSGRAAVLGTVDQSPISNATSGSDTASQGLISNAGQLEMADKDWVGVSGHVAAMGVLNTAASLFDAQAISSVSGTAARLGTLAKTTTGNRGYKGTPMVGAGLAIRRGTLAYNIESTARTGRGQAAADGVLTTRLPRDIEITFGLTDRDQWSFDRADD